jgi:hypothetical protein
LLGIQDPVGDGSGTNTMRPDGGTGRDDGGTEPMGDHLEISAGTAVSLMTNQHMRFRVTRVDASGTRTDVTGNAALGLNLDTQTYAKFGTLDAGAATLDTLAAGTAHITATFTMTGATVMPATLTATVTATLCHPVINEFTTGTDTPTTGAADEYVEIYNPCTVQISVDQWTLDYRSKSATTDSTLLATLAGAMNAGDIRLYAGAGYKGTGPTAAIPPLWTGTTGQLQQLDGGLGLRNGPADIPPMVKGDLIDAVAYGKVLTQYDFTELAPTAEMANNVSASRARFDGNDSDNNVADFVLAPATLTPNALNHP